MPKTILKSPYAPDPAIPGFPLEIDLPSRLSPANVVILMRVFRGACEQGNMPLANDTFVTLRAAINEYALHHFTAVADHMKAAIVMLDNPPSEES